MKETKAWETQQGSEMWGWVHGGGYGLEFGTSSGSRGRLSAEVVGQRKRRAPWLGHLSRITEFTESQKSLWIFPFNLPPKQTKDTFWNPSRTVTWKLLYGPQGRDLVSLEAVLDLGELFLMLPWSHPFKAQLVPVPQTIPWSPWFSGAKPPWFLYWECWFVIVSPKRHRWGGGPSQNRI